MILSEIEWYAQSRNKCYCNFDVSCLSGVADGVAIAAPVFRNTVLFGSKGHTLKIFWTESSDLHIRHSLSYFSALNMFLSDTKITYCWSHSYDFSQRGLCVHFSQSLLMHVGIFYIYVYTLLIFAGLRSVVLLSLVL